MSVDNEALSEESRQIPTWNNGVRPKCRAAIKALGQLASLSDMQTAST